MNKTDHKGGTALMYSISAESRPRAHQCVRALLAANASIDAQDQEGITVLMLACSDPDRRLYAHLLLDEAQRLGLGMRLDLTSRHGNTALMYACQHSTTECVQSLLRTGAAMNVANNNGHTALMLACLTGKEQCAAALVAAGADEDSTDNDGISAAEMLRTFKLLW